MAACKLASKGLTLLDSSYQSEVKNIQTFLSMQRSNSAAPTAQTDDSINTHSLVSPRYHKKYKPKQVERPWNLPVMSRYTMYCLFHLFLFVSVNPSYPGGLPERRPALVDVRHLEVPADLASSAWFWDFLLHGQVKRLSLEAQKHGQLMMCLLNKRVWVSCGNTKYLFYNSHLHNTIVSQV